MAGSPASLLNMRPVIIHKYTKATPADITTILRRQTYKVWDHGDTITYGLPGGKMMTYQFLDRKADAEVLEAAPLGWSAPSAPAIVYEVEVGLTKDPNVIIIGDYVSTSSWGQLSGYSINDSIYTEVASQPLPPQPLPPQLQQQPRAQQHVPKNPRHTNQFKRQQQQTQQQTNSIPLSSYLHVKHKETEVGPVRRKLQPKIPMMSIPLTV